MTRTIWSAAAAILLVLLATIFFTQNGKSGASTEELTQQQPPADPLHDINPVYAKEVYHFTELIELKQQELQKIGKDQPELYKKFVTDITRLDSSYKVLKGELP